MKKIKYFLASSILIASTALAAHTGEYMSVTNDIDPNQGSLVGKPLDLHVSGVASDGVTPKTYVIPPHQTEPKVYLWHDGTLSDINVAYTAYYAGTDQMVDSRTLPGIKVYYNGSEQKFPCSASISIAYVNQPNVEYNWSTLSCK